MRRVSEEVDTLNGQPAVCMFFDKEKFYDRACLHKLIDQAFARNFSTRLLYIAMQACLSERIQRAEEMVGQSIQPSNGILAGCSLGNRFGRVILYSILDSVNNESCLHNCHRPWKPASLWTSRPCPWPTTRMTSLAQFAVSPWSFAKSWKPPNSP